VNVRQIPRGYSRDGALAALEDSLRRLDTDRIDTVLIHDPDGYAVEALDGAYAALDQLRSGGTIRASASA
jgi:D-threo-aldose 1-dehydrogenase